MSKKPTKKLPPWLKPKGKDAEDPKKMATGGVVRGAGAATRGTKFSKA